MTYKASIIGCGRIGCSFDDDPKRKYISTHAGAYTKVIDTKLVALVDKDEKLLNKYKKKFNVSSIYTNYVKMLKQIKPDIISICTWDNTHYEITKKAVENNVKAIFCEKPIASKLKDAKEMIKICNKNKVVLMIDHQRRFCKFHQTVKKMIDKGKLGEIQQVSFYYTAGIANSGSHMFDLLRFFFGDVDWVSATKSKNLSPNKNDPNFDGMMEFKNGIFCTIQACDVNKFLVFDMDIIGSNSRFKLTHSGFDYEYDIVKDSHQFSGYKELYTSEKKPIDKKIIRQPMLDGVKHLVNCLKNNEKPISSGEDGLRSLELICAFHESAKKDNKKINLPLKTTSIEIKSR